MWQWNWLNVHDKVKKWINRRCQEIVTTICKTLNILLIVSIWSLLGGQLKITQNKCENNNFFILHLLLWTCMHACILLIYKHYPFKKKKKFYIEMVVVKCMKLLKDNSTRNLTRFWLSCYNIIYCELNNIDWGEVGVNKLQFKCLQKFRLCW